MKWEVIFCVCVVYRRVSCCKCFFVVLFPANPYNWIKMALNAHRWCHQRSELIQTKLNSRDMQNNEKHKYVGQLCEKSSRL